MSSESERTQPWEDFEAEVAARFQREVESYRTWMNPYRAKFFRQAAYWSKDRGSKIAFDVAVEGWEEGASEPSLLWVIECKDYPVRRVEVGKVEEFAQKLEQIAPMRVKGTMVTRVGFQDAALNLAEARGISLFVLNKELVRILHFDAQLGEHTEIQYTCVGGVNGRTGERMPPGTWHLDQLVQIELRRCGLLPPIPK